MDYSPEVERRFQMPTHAGTLSHSSTRAGGQIAAGEAEDRTLNVWVRFEVQALDGLVTDTRFRAYGCPHTIAAASVVAERLIGRPVAQLGIDTAAIARELAVPKEKLGKLLRLEDAVADCARRLGGAAG